MKCFFLIFKMCILSALSSYMTLIQKKSNRNIGTGKLRDERDY